METEADVKDQPDNKKVPEIQKLKRATNVLLPVVGNFIDNSLAFDFESDSSN